MQFPMSAECGSGSHVTCWPVGFCRPSVWQRLPKADITGTDGMVVISRG